MTHFDIWFAQTIEANGFGNFIGSIQLEDSWPTHYS